MTAFPIEILGASFFATDHASAEDALAGVAREFTPPRFPLLVGRARRFTSLVTQLHMEVVGALPRQRAEPGEAVFATCHGEIQAAEKLIADFGANGMVSSAQFAHSVHNTPSGLYSMATGNPAATITFTGENAVAAAWLEAALIAHECELPVLLSIADEPVPAVFRGPEGGGAAAAFLIGPPRGSDESLAARLVVERAPWAPEPTVRVLARAASAIARRSAADVELGPVLADGALRLRIDPDQAPAGAPQPKRSRDGSGDLAGVPA